MSDVYLLRDDGKRVVVGDDFEIQRTVTDIPAGQTLSKAWFTVKVAASEADPGLIQKEITSTDAPGTGHITDTGADGVGALRFDLTAANTLSLKGGKVYRYDIQVKTSANKIASLEHGIWVLEPQYTVDST